MVEKPNLGSIDPRPSAAFQLGFYSRHFKPTILNEALAVLWSKIPPNIFAGLQNAVIAREVGGDKVATSLADDSLDLTHPCRVFYDLGAAFGDYLLQEHASGKSPTAGRIWDCVRRLQKHITKDTGCLHELARQANGERDLKAVTDRVLEELYKSKPYGQQLIRSLDKHTELPISSEEPDYFRLRVAPDLIEFVEALNQEIAAWNDILDDTRPEPKTLRVRLSVDFDGKTACLDGRNYPLGTEEACCYVAALVDARGEWRRPKQIIEKYPGFKGSRTERVRAKLPPPIECLIETGRSYGSRIPLERILSKR